VRVYDRDGSYVICDDVSLPASLQLTSLTKRDNGGCFTQTVNSRSLQSAAEALHFNEGSFPTGNHFSADAEFDTANLTTFEPGKSLEERQFDSCYQWQESP
jgi:hypothetical protein